MQSNARGRSVKEEHKTNSACQNAAQRIKAVQGNEYCADCGCPSMSNYIFWYNSPTEKVSVKAYKFSSIRWEGAQNI